MLKDTSVERVANDLNDDTTSPLSHEGQREKEVLTP